MTVLDHKTLGKDKTLGEADIDVSIAYLHIRSAVDMILLLDMATHPADSSRADHRSRRLGRTAGRFRCSSIASGVRSRQWQVKRQREQDVHPTSLPSLLSVEVQYLATRHHGLCSKLKALSIVVPLFDIPTILPSLVLHFTHHPCPTRLDHYTTIQQSFGHYLPLYYSQYSLLILYPHFTIDLQ